MARVKNIEDYRKKRRKKVLLRRVLFFLFIIFIVLGGWMIYRSYQNSIVDQGVAEQKNTSFPVSLKGDAIKGFTMCGSNVALLTDKEYMLYSAKGRTLQTVQHGYFNPSIKSSSKRILIYDISCLLYTSGIIRPATFLCVKFLYHRVIPFCYELSVGNNSGNPVPFYYSG